MKSILSAAALCLFLLLTSSSAINLQGEEFCSMHAAGVSFQPNSTTTGLQQEEGPPSPPQGGPHGPFQGKKFCYNLGKNKNCECFRDCVNGVPAKEQKCKNFCYEDKCKCKTKCQS